VDACDVCVRCGLRRSSPVGDLRAIPSCTSSPGVRSPNTCENFQSSPAVPWPLGACPACAAVGLAAPPPTPSISTLPHPRAPRMRATTPRLLDALSAVGSRACYNLRWHCFLPPYSLVRRSSARPPPSPHPHPLQGPTRTLPPLVPLHQPRGDSGDFVYDEKVREPSSAGGDGARAGHEARWVRARGHVQVRALPSPAASSPGRPLTTRGCDGRAAAESP